MEEEAARQRSNTTTSREAKKEGENEKSKRKELDKKAKLDDLKKFASMFKLNTAVPTDLVPILAKDEEKQEEIVLKGLQAQHEYKKRQDGSK